MTVKVWCISYHLASKIDITNIGRWCGKPDSARPVRHDACMEDHASGSRSKARSDIAIWQHVTWVRVSDEARSTMYFLICLLKVLIGFVPIIHNLRQLCLFKIKHLKLFQACFPSKYLGWRAENNKCSSSRRARCHIGPDNTRSGGDDSCHQRQPEACGEYRILWQCLNPIYSAWDGKHSIKGNHQGGNSGETASARSSCSLILSTRRHPQDCSGYPGRHRHHPVQVVHADWRLMTWRLMNFLLEFILIHTICCYTNHINNYAQGFLQRRGEMWPAPFQCR